MYASDTTIMALILANMSRGCLDRVLIQWSYHSCLMHGMLFDVGDRFQRTGVTRWLCMLNPHSEMMRCVYLLMYLGMEPVNTCLFTGIGTVCTVLPRVPSWLREPLSNPITPDSANTTALKRKHHGCHSEQRCRCAHQIRRPKTPSQPYLLSLPPILHFRLGDWHRRRRLNQA